MAQPPETVCHVYIALRAQVPRAECTGKRGTEGSRQTCERGRPAATVKAEDRKEPVGGKAPAYLPQGGCAPRCSRTRSLLPRSACHAFSLQKGHEDYEAYGTADDGGSSTSDSEYTGKPRAGHKNAQPALKG